MSGSDRKTFVSCPSLVTKLFPKATERSWTLCHCECFHFLDGSMCDAICSKERALQFGGPRGLTVPGPLASFSKVDTGRQQIRPQNKARFSSPEEQVPASSEREKKKTRLLRAVASDMVLSFYKGIREGYFNHWPLRLLWCLSGLCWSS